MFNLSILTPEAVFFEGEVVSLKVPGKEGYMEILAHHAPLIASLKKGTLALVTKNDERLTYQITGGFLEVAGNRAAVLADDIPS